MTALEFNIVHELYDIVYELNKISGTVEAFMKPIDDGKDEIIRFEVTCVPIFNEYSCSRIFFMEDILLEENYKEYFRKRVAALIIKCLKHSI